MSEACRLCLETPVESFQHMNAYLKEVSFILPEIDVNLTDSPIICCRCSDLLLSAYTFKCSCLKIEGELKERINQAVCVVTNFSEEIIEDKDLFDTVKNELFENEADDSKCKEENNEDFKIVIQSDNKKFLCQFCEQEFDEHSWNEHLETHTGSKYNCEACCVGFTDRTELRMHRKSNHAEHQCSMCDKKFLYKAVLNRHLQEHASGKNQFECNICGMKKRMKFQLMEHMRVHTGERPYKCKFCPKSFAQGSTLSTHIRTMHLTDRPFICEICGKCYAVRGQYTSHMRSHAINIEKKFICNFCGKAYLIQSKLQQHLRRHTGEKPMVCHFCSKRFADKSDLNRHFLTHTGERRYECPICQKKFGRKGNMDVHTKSCSRRHSVSVMRS